MLAMLIAYGAGGDVIATLDYMVAKDPEGRVVGLVDFGAHEAAGGDMLEVWQVDGAKGSKAWPEWIGSRAHEFRVELAGPAGRKRISALVHKTSGHRRERAAVETAIADRISAGDPADIRDLVGGPELPLLLDDDGRTRGRTAPPSGTPASLPLVRRSPGEAR